MNNENAVSSRRFLAKLSATVLAGGNRQSDIE
jgi:hypothetical protein